MDSASPSIPPPPPPPPLELNNLRALRVLGRGAMGTVFLVHDVVSEPSAKSLFALKVVDKAVINSKLDGDRRARWEIRVLRRISGDPIHHHHPNPFLPRLIGTIETHEFLAWATPYCPGGDLNVLRRRQIDGVFSSAVIRFYLAEIICALEHIHSMGIVYRDLKPENILVQMSGHVILTDFDLSRCLRKKTHIKPESTNPIPNPNRNPSPTRGHRRSLTRWLSLIPSDGKLSGLKKAKSARVSPVGRRVPSLAAGERSNSFVGTEEYVSPEVVRGEGHEFAVDWWALGVLAYEMMYGMTPFKGKNRKETFRNVLHKQPEFVGDRTELIDLIGKLLAKEPTKRLGYYGGASEIKQHVFFNGVKWDLLMAGSRPPFIPSRDDGDAVNGGGIEITEYFKKLKLPPSAPSSPASEGYRTKISFEEY
ncbi:PREDICTED: serine/threonine-protein kinase UCNL-like [Tarenaya hassleriana]|uniref:serine/threonine-protein kinase UCNL-like n=1 Tax=Tarenaya hassleriana TaxID=28532 RepID=UPI00053C2E81|nr:PREDICTED: serine/threonine-protein kinase UCNL-like [Tarenaya hassleriana]